MSIHHNSQTDTQKTALLVGGSSAVGAAVCDVLVRRGYRCVVHGGYDGKKLDAIRQRHGKSVQIVQYAARTPKELCLALKAHYSVDLLCVLHGPMKQKSRAKTKAADWAQMMEWNFSLPVELTFQASPHMKPGGMIFYFGFLEDPIRQVFTHTAAYATAKQSLHMFVQQIAPVLQEQELRCFCIAPDFINTASGAQRERWKSYAKTGKLLEPQDLAETLAWILESPTVVNALIVPIKKW